MLGLMYERVLQDYAEAANWYERAAIQGHAMSQSKLGAMYDDGRGVSQNFAEAAKWFRSAAEQGDATAQFGLGAMYAAGGYLTQDYAEAMKWFLKAAEQGDHRSELSLGFMYMEGRGVHVDDSEAVRWFRRAAVGDDAAAQKALGSMYFNGRGVPLDYALAIKWFRKAANRGDSAAQRSLGFMYGDGQGVAIDQAEAVRWLRKAAEQGDAPAQSRLGFMYQEGSVLARDSREAAKWSQWFREAAKDTPNEDGAEHVDWHVEGCDFSVAFPSSPTVTDMYATGFAYKRAELKTDSSILRAECLQMKFPKEKILAGLKAQAVGDGLKNWAIQEISVGVYELRGYKVIQGRSATYVLQAHSGVSSLLSLMVAAASDDYPTSDTGAFLRSVESLE
jgi:TPR repeat protein